MSRIWTHEPGFDRVDEIRRFREDVYSRDGVSIASTEWLDPHSWHIVSRDADGRLVGCLRYTSVMKSWGWASGWASEKVGVGANLIKEGIELSWRLGQRTLAVATARRRAIDLLLRLGGVPLLTRYEEAYDCETTLVLFEGHEHDLRTWCDR